MRRAVWFVLLSLSILIAPSSVEVQHDSRVVTNLNSGPVGGTDYPWTMFRYDSARSGATQASGPTSPSLMWSYPTGAQVYPSPIVDSGLVLIPSYDGTLYVINEYTGTLVWSFQTGAPIFATPAVSNGVVYLASKDQGVYALDELTGKPIWERANISPLPRLR